jgi:hypothetical protein
MANTAINASNYKIFVVMELGKLVPITDEVSWWHLLEFYYSTTEKLEKHVWWLLIKHMTFDNNFSNCYRPFFTQVANGFKWGMAPLSKMVKLACSLVGALGSDNAGEFVKEGTSRKWGHLEFMADCLCTVLNYSASEFPNYT